MINFFYTTEYLSTIIRIAILIIIGIPCVRIISNFFASVGRKRFSAHIGLLTGHVVFYSGLLFLGITILQECGFNVTALLGAAGVLGVAIGFASQTSISNIISGFFLLLERPFSIGDIIKSGEMTGTVESIDLLSIRIRTTDNKLVRLPNEMVLKHHLTNLTYYSIKRINILLSVPYTENIEQCKTIAQKVAASDPLFLTNPSPVIMVQKVAQHECTTEMRLFFSLRVWIDTTYFTSAPALLMQKLKEEYDKNNITITVTHIN
jgi:small-conductance mechanosensitive channel